MTYRSLLAIGVLMVASGDAFSQTAQAPTGGLSKGNLEFSGGWIHSTGDNGLDGYNLGAAIWFTRRISVGFEYDHAGDTSSIGVFSLTSVGLVTVKSTMQSWLVGPRVFFPSKTIKRFDVDPFAEFKIGATHLNQRLSQVGGLSQSASDSAYSWMLGGGADYVVSPHWALRGNLDLLRTHLVESGQTRLRFVVGVNYTFLRRK
jgi:opacity protein-like surface antigen